MKLLAATAGTILALALGGASAQAQAQTFSPSIIIIHATDNIASATNEAHFAQTNPEGTTAHFYVDEHSTVAFTPTTQIAYGAYSEGNKRAVQFELVGKSGHISDATMRQAAPEVRKQADKFHIPITKLTPAQLRAGQRGITGHADVTAAWHQGDHSDPGKFDWAGFLAYIQKA